MKALLDTTYLLPTIGIAIKEIPKNTLLELCSKGHEIAISEVTIFELSAKGAKYAQNNALSPERVALGIRSILYDDSIKKISTYDTSILLTAFSLRSLMGDFIDCLILSTALHHCDALITEDQVISGLKKNEKYLKLKSTINPEFKILPSSEVQKP